MTADPGCLGVSKIPYLGSDLMILYLQLRGSKLGDLVCSYLFFVQEALTGEQAWIRFLDLKLLLVFASKLRLKQQLIKE